MIVHERGYGDLTLPTEGFKLFGIAAVPLVAAVSIGAYFLLRKKKGAMGGYRRRKRSKR